MAAGVVTKPDCLAMVRSRRWVTTVSSMPPTIDASGAVAAARALHRSGPRVVLGIAGAPGSGKTTLAEQLVRELASDIPVAHLPMDGFHLGDAALDALGRRKRKGAPDTFDVHGYIAVLQRLRARVDEMVFAPSFARDLEQPIAASIVIPRAAELIVTEGNYLLLDEAPWNGVRSCLDACWYVDIDDDVRRERLVDRHIRFGKSHDEASAWVNSVDEPNARLITASRHKADLTVAWT